MAVSRRVVLGACLAVVVVAGAGVGIRQWLQGADPCRERDKAVLLERYPELRRLDERQHMEAEGLLREHRRQDIRINLKLSGDEISPEDAMRLSVQQINELAELRNRHQEEFLQRCRAVTRGGD